MKKFLALCAMAAIAACGNTSNIDLTMTLVGYIGTGGLHPAVDLVNIEVSLIDPNTQLVAYGPVTTSVSASPALAPTVSFSNPTGIYDICIKADGWLGEVIPAQTLVSGNTYSYAFTQQFAGNFNHDHEINLMDFDELILVFGSSYPVPPYTIDADFNRDGDIDLWDHALLWNNFGLIGCP